jgi:hypothetical protein
MTTVRPAPCSTGDLRDQLECAFRGPEIGQVETGIRIYDTDNRNPWEIQPLRNHLRSKENVHLPLVNRF